MWRDTGHDQLNIKDAVESSSADASDERRQVDKSHVPRAGGALPAVMFSAADGQHGSSRVPRAAAGSPASKVRLLTLSSVAAVD